jgi:hypothetical protein
MRTKGMMKWVVLLLQQLLAHGQEPPRFAAPQSKPAASDPLANLQQQQHLVVERKEW